MKGSNFLKVTGILMIIGGALSIILSIIAVLGVAALALLGASSGLLYVSAILAILSAVVQLIAGIKGAKNAKDPVKGSKCLAWGIVVIALSVVGQILSVAGGGGFDVVSLLVGLVVPVLYIIGAIQLKGEINKVDL